MGGKLVVIVLLACVAIALLWSFRSDSKDAEVARQLSREANRVESVTPNELPDLFKVSATLVAERDSQGDSWTLSQGDYSTSIVLPFAPTRDGTLPQAEFVDDTKPDENPGFLGAEACAECHRDHYEGFVETAHHLTSGRVTNGNIRGYFDGPNSRLSTNDPQLSFVLSDQGDQLVQTVHYDDWQLSFPMDVFTGSAKSGQTMLYWHGDALYQAHVSYLTKTDSWITSPGFSDTNVVYSRVIRAACLECHITYIDQKQAPNHFHPDSAVYGISCERCHSPGNDHVQYHQQFPQETKSMHIVQPSKLTRQQRLEICAQCHSGSVKLLKDAFTFVPGEKLDEYHRPVRSSASGAAGIHTSNQLTRLSMSACFQQTEMTCTTCHNPHENQHGNTKVFTEACFRCHQIEQCGMSAELGDRIADGCVGCHMPLAENEDLQGIGSDLLSVKMVDHYIRVVTNAE